MDEKEKYSLDNLEKYSYRVLQRLAKSLALPSNVKKLYLKELIHTKMFGTEEELESIIHLVKVDRLKTSQARKKKKIIKKLHLQGTEITSTCGTPSPPLSQVSPNQTMVKCTPDPELTFSPPPKPIKTYASPKKSIGSDRVLRSFNMGSRRPNYSILNSSVVEVFKTTRMREKERVSQSKINMTAKCVVKRIPESWEDDDEPLVPLSRRSRNKIIVMACSSLPEKRQKTVSGICPITKDNSTDINQKYFKSINFRCTNGRVSKINAVIRKSTSTINLPPPNTKVNTQVVLPNFFVKPSEADYPNLSASTDSLQSVMHDKPYAIQYTKQYNKQTQKRKNQLIVKTNIAKYNSGSSEIYEMPKPTWHFEHMPSPTWHHQHLPDYYANSSNYIPDQSYVPNQQYFPQYNDFPSYEENYQDWSVPSESHETDFSSTHIMDSKSHQGTDESSYHTLQMRSHQIQEVSSYQSLNLTTYQKTKLPSYQRMDVQNYQRKVVPRYQSMDVPSQPRMDMRSQQRMDMSSNQKMDMPSYQRMDVPSYKSIDAPSQPRMDMASNQRMDEPNYQRTDVPSYQRMVVPSQKRLDVPIHQRIDEPSRRINVPQYQCIKSSQQRPDSHQLIDMPNHQINIPYHQQIETQCHQRKNVTSQQGISEPNHQSDTLYHQRVKLPSNQKVELISHQNIEFQSLQSIHMPSHQKIDLPSYQRSNVQSFEGQRHQRIDAPCHHRVDIPHNQKVDLSSQQCLNMPSHQVMDMPCYARPHSSSIYTECDIGIQENSSRERLPKINAVFSKFRDIHMDVTQPLYVQVSKESERLPTSQLKTTNVNMLESLYNFRSQFTVHQPLLKIATTNNTTCVYSTTPVMACAIPQKTSSSEKTNLPSCEPADPFEFTIEPDTLSTKAPEPFGSRMQDYDTEMTASNSSLNTCNSQDLDATIPEMVEDAMELISQDGDYMERLGMDVKVQCVFCEWSGSNFVIEYHVRNQHADRIHRKAKPEWNITFSIHSLIQDGSWHSRVVEQDNTLYVLCVKYAEPGWLMAAIYALYDETIAQEAASITIYNKVTGEPFTWEGDLTHLPPNFIPDNPNCLKLALSKLNLIPNSANLEIVNGELVPTCSSKVVVGHLELTDLQVIVFVKIFKRDVYY